MSKPSQTSASDNVFQLWKCSCLSDFLICYFVLPGNPQNPSLPSVVCCFEFFPSFVWLRLATALHCWVTWRGLVLHKALFSLANWFSDSSIICLVLRKRQLLCRFAHWLLDPSSQWLICSSHDTEVLYCLNGSPTSIDVGTAFQTTTDHNTAFIGIHT